MMTNSISVIKTLALCLLATPCLCATIAFGTEIRYAELSFSMQSNTSGELSKSPIFVDVILENSIGGFFYVTDSSSGIVSSSRGEDRQDWNFAILFTLRFPENGNSGDLSVSTSLYKCDTGRLTPLTSIAVDTNLLVDQSIQVSSFRLDDDRSVRVELRTLSRCPNDDQSCGLQAITLISSLLSNGKQVERVVNVRRLIAERIAFEIYFKAGCSDSMPAEECRYQASLFMPGAMQALKSPTDCKVELHRSYFSHPSSHFTPSPLRQLFTTDRSTTHSREVELLPGQPLRLAFPPDSGSVMGFQIVDTLIILPK